MKKKFIIYFLGVIVVTILTPSSCTLDEEILDEYTAEVLQSDPELLPNLLAPPLAQMRQMWWRQSFWGFQEATSDELCFPTRGTDWYDNAVWQRHYLHTWIPTHRDVVDTWNRLSSGISYANTAILNLGEESADDQGSVLTGRAQAKFLRAFYEYAFYDLYRVYPVRDPFNLDFSVQPTYYKGEAGFYRLVTILKAQLPYMKKRDYQQGTDPSYLESVYGEPTQDAARMLLAKLYLNKEVYVGVSGYDSCLIYINQIIESGSYGLANDYFNMFAVDNDGNYKAADDEGIFVTLYDDSDNFGHDDNVQWVKTTFHYNQTLGGAFPTGTNWNGCMAPEEYLQEVWINGTDTATDVRWKDDRLYSQMAVMLGFNYGQQYDAESGDSLEVRGGGPLNFTFECPLEGALENEGVRVLKYPPREDPINTARFTNDYLVWRYADALLMKAECVARAGNMSEAEDIVNEIRVKRNAPEISGLTLEDILDERGRELYWEGHRRQDMIRFGTFTSPKTNKPSESPATAILLPIPQNAIDGSEGLLTQNPGY